MRPISVLIVDHSSAFRRIAAFFLHECHQGEVAVIGLARGDQEALEQVQALRPDIVLVDAPTAEPAGLGAISRKREALPQLGVILLGLLGTDSYRRAALKAGADDFRQGDPGQQSVAGHPARHAQQAVRLEACGSGSCGGKLPGQPGSLVLQASPGA